MALITFFFIFFSSTSQAAFQNQLTTLLGAKAAGLGGAATSITDDPSSAAFYNPALIMFTSRDNITSSVSIYNKYNSDYGKTTSLIDAGKTVNQGFFRSIPSATGKVMKYKDFAFAASIIVPDYDFFSGEVLSNATNNTFLSYTDESLWAGGSASYKLNETSSLGVTLYYTARHLERSSLNQVTVSPTQVIIDTEEKNSTHNGLIFNLGYYNRTSDWFSWGVSVRPPLISLSGNTNFFYSRVDTLSLPAVSTRYENLKTTYKVPMKTSIGFTVHPTQQSLIAFDIHHFWATSYNDVEEALAQDYMNYTNKTNASLGFQYDFDEPNFTIRGGIFSNLSSVSGLTEGIQSVRQPDRIDMLGLSGNISFKTHENVEYTFGGFFNAGNGTAIERLDNKLQTIGKDQKIFTMLVSVMIGL